MMVNDETYADTNFSKFVAAHEIAHTYMPFYMGINETRYGFMDEGWATTFELLIGRVWFGEERADEFYRQFRVYGWINDTSPDEEIPVITPGDALNGPGFGNNEYGKASLGYLAVKDLLGDDLALQHVSKTPTSYTLTINNIGGMATPVNAKLTYVDGTGETIHLTPAIWQASQKTAKVNRVTCHLCILNQAHPRLRLL